MKILKYLFFALLLLAFSIFGCMKITDKNTSELGLGIFSWIKKVKGENVQIDKMTPSKLKSIDYAEWSDILVMV